MKNIFYISFSLLLFTCCSTDKVRKGKEPQLQSQATSASFSSEPYNFSKINEQQVEEASMQMKSKIYYTTDTYVTAILRLPSSGSTTMDRQYHLQKFYCGKWLPIAQTGVVFDDLFVLPSPGEIWLDFSLHTYAESLHSGKYRILKDVEINNKVRTLSAEFMLLVK